VFAAESTPLSVVVAPLQRKEINILKRVSFNRNVVQFYGFCLEEQAPMLVRNKPARTCVDI
jgi:hypothetical protein